MNRATLLLLTLALAAATVTGCGRKAQEEVTATVTAVVEQYNAGQAREATSMLLGQAVDASSWRRSGEMVRRVRNRTSVHQAEACGRNLERLAAAIELYRADDEYGQYLPERLADLVATRQIDAVPGCPSAGRDTYSASYRVSGDWYRLACSGHHHAAAGLASGSPRLDARWGLSADAPVARWWPRTYRLAVDRIETRGTRARVVLEEQVAYDGQPPARCPVELQLVASDTGQGRKWVVAPDLANDSTSLLGTLLYAAVNAPPAETAKASRASCQQGLQRVATALEMWSSDHDGQYPSRLSQLVPEYARELTGCGSMAGAKPRYQVSFDAEVYLLGCAGSHKDVQVSNSDHPSSAFAPTVGVGTP